MEGYWTSKKFTLQIEHAYEIAEVKYLTADGWKVVWVFDLSSRHKAMALDASKNEHQPWWQATGNVGHRLGRKGGEDLGVAKGMRQV